MAAANRDLRAVNRKAAVRTIAVNDQVVVIVKIVVENLVDVHNVMIVHGSKRAIKAVGRKRIPSIIRLPHF